MFYKFWVVWAGGGRPLRLNVIYIIYNECVFRPTFLDINTPSTSAQAAGFVPLPVPIAGTPWKCPEWLTHDNDVKEFNGILRTQFKRKMTSEMET